MIWLAALLLALSITITAGGAVARPASDGVATLRAALAIVRAGESAGAPERERAARSALALLEADPLLARHAWLHQPLRSDPPDLGVAVQRLQAAVDTLTVATGPHAPTQEAADILDGILGATPFTPVDSVSTLPAWLQPIGRSVIELQRQVSDAADRVGRFLMESAIRAVLWLIESPLVLAAGAVAVVVTLILYRSLIRSAIVQEAQVASDLGQGRLSPQEAVRLAEEHANAGRYREACRYLLHSAFLQLDARGEFAFDRAATNREHLARLPTSNRMRLPLSGMVHRFDLLWYGDQPAAEADYRELARLAAAIRDPER